MFHYIFTGSLLPTTPQAGEEGQQWWETAQTMWDTSSGPLVSFFLFFSMLLLLLTTIYTLDFCLQVISIIPIRGEKLRKWPMTLGCGYAATWSAHILATLRHSPSTLRIPPFKIKSENIWGNKWCDKDIYGWNSEIRSKIWQKAIDPASFLLVMWLFGKCQKCTLHSHLLKFLTCNIINKLFIMLFKPNASNLSKLSRY